MEGETRKTDPDEREGRFGCTANLVWEGGDNLYLGAAGHCFIPAATKATHGAGADYDPSGVDVHVCVNNCDANFRSMTLVGELVLLGKVAYARQTNATGEEQVGHDFGVVEILPSSHRAFDARCPSLAARRATCASIHRIVEITLVECPEPVGSEAIEAILARAVGRL